MFQFSSQLSSKYNELVQEVPEAERMFDEFMNVEPTEFSNVTQRVRQLILSVEKFDQHITELAGIDSSNFRKIFGHDSGTSIITLGRGLD